MQQAFDEFILRTGLEDFRSLEFARDGRVERQRSRLSQDKGHRGIWEAFAQSVTNVSAPPIPLAQIFGVSRASIAAVRALRSGERVAIASIKGGDAE